MEYSPLTPLTTEKLLEAIGEFRVCLSRAKGME